MNQRIQALADEAEAYADSVMDRGGEFHTAYTKRLAELIVRECADVGFNAAYPDKGVVVLTAIKEHFGVEE